jgi:signal transduction histidine kinase
MCDIMASDLVPSDRATALSRVWPLAGFALMYFLLAWASEHLMLAPALGVAIWPPGGLLLVMLLRVPRSERVPLLAIAMTADIAASVILFKFPMAVAVPIAIGNALEGFVGSALLRRSATRDFEIVDIRSAAAFIGLAGFTAPLCSMVLGGTAVGLHTDTPLLESWRLWWTGDALGILIVGPFALAVGSDAWDRLFEVGPFRHGEFIGLVSVVCLMGYLCLAMPYPIAFATLPPIIWAALRHGLAGSSFAVGLTVVQAVLYAAHGIGPFVDHLSLAQTQLVVQAFGVVAAMTGLLLTGSAIQEGRAKGVAEALVAQRTGELRQREAQLESALEELRKGDARKDDFMAILAHELRNPIAPLRYGLTILDQSNLPDRGAEVRRMMGRQIDQLVMLIDDLFDLASIKSGKLRLELVPVPVREVALAAVAAVQDRVDKKRQTLVTRLPSADVTIRGDKGRLQQVLVNLLANASRHCPEGTTVQLRMDTTPQGTVVEVEDDGPGIAPERREAIFGLYEQSRRDAGEGLGIGLALVRQLVELHGGRVEVHSEVGVGSVFRIVLPT